MKNGLKGVTDAMVFCKSMKSGGEKNQIMRSMSSYELGGVTGLQSPNAVSAESDCTYVMEGYPPKKKKNVVVIINLQEVILEVEEFQECINIYYP